jgi:hypothetical protein
MRLVRTGSNAPADLPRQRLKGTWTLKRIDSIFRSSLERVRATESYRIGRSRRFRAAQRRRTRATVRIALLVVIGAYAFDIVASGDHGLIVVALDVGLIGLAFLGWWSLTHHGRHHPELMAWIVTSGTVFTMAATAVAVPELAIQSAGYLLVLPGLVALLPFAGNSQHEEAWLSAVHPEYRTYRQ